MNEMSDVNQIVNNIKEEITRSEPSSTRIINLLYDLRTREEYQTLTDSEFYDIVGETFKLNQDFFMKHIYEKWKNLFFQARVIVNEEEMGNYIFEKYCFYDGEQILYKFRGKIELTIPSNSMVKVSVETRSIIVTNYRIIAQGTLQASGGRNKWGPGLIGGLLLWGATGGSKRGKGITGVIESSTQQELPCYGYQFQTKNHIGLVKKGSSIRYAVPGDTFVSKGTSSRFKETKEFLKARRIIKITIQNNNKEQINKLFEILCKDANQVLTSIKEELEKENPSKFIIPAHLDALSVSEEYQHLSDSEYIDIVGETYKLNPQFFMTSIFPNMKSWKIPILENFRGESEEQIINNIKEDIKKEISKAMPRWPSKSIILSYLFGLQLFSYSEFLDIIGEIFKANPKFFIKMLYNEVKKETGKLYGFEKQMEMEKHIKNLDINRNA